MTNHHIHLHALARACVCVVHFRVNHSVTRVPQSFFILQHAAIMQVPERDRVVRIETISTVDTDPAQISTVRA